MMDYTVLNAAIVEHLGLWWTPEREAAIKHGIGSDGLAAIRAMYDLAADEDLWLHRSQEEAYELPQRRIEKKYPFLAPEAVRRLANMAAYAWK